LNSLCKSFPEETEILARARSYITICQREEKTSPRHEPTADQLYAMGVMEHNKAHYDEAISYYRQSMKSHPGGDYIYYSIAASFAKKGDFAESMGNLKKAIELNEDSRIYARNDDDFAAFLTHEEFAELVGITQNPADEPQ
jgi:tetratricopeptide (TPR) repeat protein